jgi:hypothetical protein
MKELEQQASVLIGDGADAHPSFVFWAEQAVPGDEALGTIDLICGRPKKGATEPVQSGEHARGKLEGSHGESGQSVEHCVEQDHPPTGE